MGVFLGPVQSDGKQLVKIYDPWTGEGASYIWKKEDADSFQKLRIEENKKTLKNSAIIGVLGTAIAGTIAVISGGKSVDAFEKAGTALIGGIFAFTGGLIGSFFKTVKTLDKFIKKTNEKNAAEQTLPPTTPKAEA